MAKRTDKPKPKPQKAPPARKPGWTQQKSVEK
jgi:hypothetical protein